MSGSQNGNNGCCLVVYSELFPPLHGYPPAPTLLPSRSASGIKYTSRKPAVRVLMVLAIPVENSCTSAIIIVVLATPVKELSKMKGNSASHSIDYKQL